MGKRKKRAKKAAKKRPSNNPAGRTPDWGVSRQKLNVSLGAHVVEALDAIVEEMRGKPSAKPGYGRSSAIEELLLVNRRVQRRLKVSS